METKGITIEFYGKTVELEDSIKDINKGLKLTKAEVSDLNKNLKLDPKNIELLERKLKGLRQEQTLLTEKVRYFEDEISKLGKEDIGTDKWNALQKELAKAQTELKKVTDTISKQEAVNERNANAIADSTTEVNKMGKAFDSAGNGAIKFGDLVKANVISQAIISGIRTIVREIIDLVGEVHEWADAYRELEVYERQFETNLRNTANATDEEIDALKDLAKQKQKEGVISKKAITSAYQELATYVESADAIAGLTDALTDMAAQQYGVDATEESVRNLATTLGKALANGDYSGLTRLGYGFNDTQKYIMKYGDELERVAVLNDVIESSIGGVNEALAQTDAGKIYQAKSYFDDIKADIGQIVSGLETGFLDDIMPKLKPIIDDGMKWIIDHTDDFTQAIADVIGWLTSSELSDFFTQIADNLQPIIDYFTGSEFIDTLMEIVGYVGDIVTDITSVLGDLFAIFDEMGLIQGLFDTFEWTVGKIKDLFDLIADTIRDIRENGLGNWFMGGAFTSYNPFANSNPFQFDNIAWSGGFMSGGSLTLNNTFTINNGNEITEDTLKGWADILTDQINENLGRMV